MTNVYLVGGYLRDLLRGEPSRDRDYAVKDDALNIATEAAEKYNGTFIELQKDRMFRVVLKDMSIIDFNVMDEKIDDDLMKRDYTVNALAWSPETGLIDPSRGLDDIDRKKLRVVRPGNLSDDPLRVLRGYRLSAQLGFTIGTKTRTHMRKYAHRLSAVSHERITEELFKLLNHNNSFNYIKLCLNDNVLNEIIDLSITKLSNNLRDINALEQYLDYAENKYKYLSDVIRCNVSQGLTLSGLLKLSLLLTKSTHNQLRISNILKNKVNKINSALFLHSGRITDKRLFDIFEISDECAMETAVILTAIKKKYVDKYMKRAQEYLSFRDKPLLNGNEIKRILNLDSCSAIGSAKTHILRRRFLGLTLTKTEARSWIISNLT
jgi:tRNA nucleotidyltransferase/poly(A) polymerase